MPSSGNTHLRHGASDLSAVCGVADDVDGDLCPDVGGGGGGAHHLLLPLVYQQAVDAGLCAVVAEGAGEHCRRLGHLQDEEEERSVGGENLFEKPEKSLRKTGTVSRSVPT